MWKFRCGLAAKPLWKRGRLRGGEDTARFKGAKLRSYLQAAGKWKNINSAKHLKAHRLSHFNDLDVICFCSFFYTQTGLVA